jgi:hypothetical protein
MMFPGEMISVKLKDGRWVKAICRRVDRGSTPNVVHYRLIDDPPGVEIPRWVHIEDAKQITR